MTAINRKARPVAKRVKNWRTMLKSLPNMTEEELAKALRLEADKPKEERRQDVILRLHRRYCKVRQTREFKELTS